MNKNKISIAPTQWLEEFAELTDKEFGQLFRAALCYAATGEEPQLEGRTIKIAFNVMKGKLDRTAAIGEVRRQSGRKGLVSRWGKMAKMANDSKALQTMANDSKEKETNKEKETAPPAPPYKEKESRRVEARARTREEGFYDELLNSPMWMQQAAAFFLLTEAELRQRLQAFQTENELKGTTHRDRQDYQRHFIDFTRIQLEKLQRNNGLDSFDAQELARRKRQASAAAYMANMLNNPEPDTLPF